MGLGMGKKVNWPIVVLGVLWWLVETRYFGWNARPGSVAELFADGMALAFYAAAFAFPPSRASVVNHNHAEVPANGRG